MNNNYITAIKYSTRDLIVTPIIARKGQHCNMRNIT